MERAAHAGNAPVPRGLVRAHNRWQNFRGATSLQLTVLEREHVIPTSIAEALRAALYEADETLTQTTFSACERCQHE